MSDIEALSHVDLVQKFEAEAWYTAPEVVLAPLRAEILRRMDSAATSQRDEIAPDPDGYRR